MPGGPRNAFETVVLARMAEIQNDSGGACWLSLENISADCRMSLRQTKRIVKSLCQKERGLIAFEKKGRSNCYRLTLPQTGAHWAPIKGEKGAQWTPFAAETGAYWAPFAAETGAQWTPGKVPIGSEKVPIGSEKVPNRHPNQKNQEEPEDEPEGSSSSSVSDGKPSRTDSDRLDFAEKKEKRRDIHWNGDSAEARRALNEALGRPPGRGFSGEEMHHLGNWIASNGGLVSAADMDDLR